MAFTTVLDACVLYPAPLKDLLVGLAAPPASLYRAKWTHKIHDEWVGGVLRDRDDLTEDKLRRTCELMNKAVPGSLVSGYEHLIETLNLKDPDDRHVLAAAIRSDADNIVTFNLKDFDKEELQKYDVYTEHPDEFVCNMLSLYTPQVIDTVRRQRARLKNPHSTVDEFLATLRKQGLPQTVDALTPYSGSI